MERLWYFDMDGSLHLAMTSPIVYLGSVGSQRSLS